MPTSPPASVLRHLRGLTDARLDAAPDGELLERFTRSRDEGLAPARAGADPLADRSARELLDTLDRELNRLPEVCRAPLVLCYLEGVSREDAARQLGCPLGTFKGRLERGKDLLRSAM